MRRVLVVLIVLVVLALAGAADTAGDDHEPRQCMIQGRLMTTCPAPVPLHAPANRTQARPGEAALGAVRVERRFPTYDEWKAAVQSQTHSKHDNTRLSKRQRRRRGHSAGRLNHVAPECGGKVLTANPEASGTTAVQSEVSDRYLLNLCAAPAKWLEFELCDEILIDTVVLANYELFSSTFRDVRVMASAVYPPREWTVLGVFAANNTRAVQVFAIENPVIWARYVRIDFLTHYGREYYCPLSIVRVHGITMMEDYRDEMEDLLLHAGASEVQDDGGNGNGGKPAPAAEAEFTATSAPTVSFFHQHVEQLSRLRPHGNTAQPHEPDPVAQLLDAFTQSATNEEPVRSTDASTEAEGGGEVATQRSAPVPLVAPVGGGPTESILAMLLRRVTAVEANLTDSAQYLQLQTQLVANALNDLEREFSARLEQRTANLSDLIAAHVHRQLVAHAAEQRASERSMRAALDELRAQVHRLELVVAGAGGLVLGAVALWLAMPVLRRVLASFFADGERKPRAASGRVGTLRSLMSDLARAAPLNVRVDALPTSGSGPLSAPASIVGLNGLHGRSKKKKRRQHAVAAT